MSKKVKKLLHFLENIVLLKLEVQVFTSLIARPCVPTHGLLFFIGEGMKKLSLKEILSLSLDIGERMLKCDAEVSRVEQTISIICKGYGIKYMEVFTMNSLIVVTLRNEKDSVTESRRIMYHKIDLDQLEKLNHLSRKICKKNISRNMVLKKIEQARVKRNNALILIGEILAATSFTLFFGGNLTDGFAAIIVASILFFIDRFTKHSNINSLIYSFLCSFIIGFLSIVLNEFGIGNSYDKVIIGNIMLLIPGLSMFISINDIFKGDTLSGIGRFTEGIFLALTIAAGVGLSLLMLGGII